MSSTETDPVRVLRGWGRFTTELAPEGAPIMLLVSGAAATDPGMAALFAEAEAQRRTRMRHNAPRRQQRSWLRPGISSTQATDILWTYSSAELYDLLVLKSGWPVKRYGEFIGNALIAALLPHERSTAHLQEILPVLELDHQYTRLVEAWNHQLVAQIRRCGRAAGKRLGYKIRTFTSNPDRRDDRRVAVWVVVTDSNPDEEDRICERSELLISQTLNQLLG